MYYKYCTMSNALRPACRQGLALLTGQGAGSGATPRFVYKPILSPDSPLAGSVAMSSGHGHEHLPKAFEGWQNWKTWQDVPDKLVAKKSSLDPNNPVYSDPKYIKIRKMQYFMQKPDGLLIHRKMGASDAILIYTTGALISIVLGFCGYTQYMASFNW
jgi:hypothetical protein